ncbi:hypothetical protein L596_011744 [Steinernema carpocapsae]|uniref:Uncharacterized protein n=1 Tax=Steinernema carpocapsae TaxID=34508 RepID=A0A4U5NVT7_STECR|nr:hypothetical protein L596_011744 [Steinernema carpocapsae]
MQKCPEQPDVGLQTILSHSEISSAAVIRPFRLALDNMDAPLRWSAPRIYTVICFTDYGNQAWFAVKAWFAVRFQQSELTLHNSR